MSFEAVAQPVSASTADRETAIGAFMGLSLYGRPGEPDGSNDGKTRRHRPRGWAFAAIAEPRAVRTAPDTALPTTAAPRGWALPDAGSVTRRWIRT